jgi:hypothetical protein
MLTSWKTSHGPQKSIITAPSETRKATGILPWVGGLSGFALLAGLFASGLLVASAGPELAERSPAVDSVRAAIKLNSAAVLSNSLPLNMFVGSFMTSTFSGERSGSNDNYHHIAAIPQAKAASFATCDGLKISLALAMFWPRVLA